MREWRKLFHTNGNQKKTRVAILILDKRDFKTKTVTRGKEDHCIMIKGSIQEEDIKIIYIYIYIYTNIYVYMYVCVCIHI